jgi:hypothetical protein
MWEKEWMQPLTLYEVNDFISYAYKIYFWCMVGDEFSSGDHYANIMYIIYKLSI